jgi:hypothetical protein
MQHFVSHHYDYQLKRHGLIAFEDFWGLPGNWVEEPNDRRGGWSGVSLHKASDGNGNSLSLFVKRQENHNYFSLRHPFKTRPTSFRDFSSILLLKQIGVATVEPVYYGERLMGDNLQAVLATVALEGYRELNLLFKDSGLRASVRQAILHHIADVVRGMHSHRLKHGSLSGNHVMVKIGDDDLLDVRILDLEKMKRSWWQLRTATCDLERLIRYTPTLTTTDHAELIRHYTRYLNPKQRRRLVTMINQRLVSRCSGRGYTVPTVDLGDMN